MTVGSMIYFSYSGAADIKDFVFPSNESYIYKFSSNSAI